MAVTNKAGEVEYAGQVLAVWYDSVQIMSDVWESAVHFRYWTGAEVKTGYRLSYEGVTATADASDEVKATAEAWQEEQRSIREQCRATDNAIRYAYGFRQGQKVRVIAGRKVPVGSVVELTTGEMPSSFDRYGTVCHVRDAAGVRTMFVNCENLEVVPAVDAAAGEEMRCPCCKQLRPVADYVYSAHDGFRVRRVADRYLQVQCVRCEAVDRSGLAEGTDGNTLAVAVLRGDLTAVCPLIDELIGAGKDQRADELRRIHKLDKPARKPRKRKADAVTAAV